MTRTLVCLSFFIVVLGLTACGGHKVKLNKENEVAKTGVLKVWAALVKDKKTRFDAQMHFQNAHAKGIIIGVEDIRCFRGNGEGKLHRMVARNISLDVGQERSFNLICDNVPDSGGFRFIIGKIYENPNGDGATRGAVIATNVEWED